MLYTNRSPAFAIPAIFSSCFQVDDRQMMRTGIIDCSQVLLPQPHQWLPITGCVMSHRKYFPVFFTISHFRGF